MCQAGWVDTSVSAPPTGPRNKPGPNRTDRNLTDLAVKPRRKPRSPGWVPDQHGAWAMLAVPLLIGVIATGATWVHLPLTILWFVGYFAFFAVGLWLKSRFKKRWFPPVRAYVLATILPALAVLVLSPGLLVWMPAYLPLVIVSLVCSYRRRERSMLNDVVTILAASLMLPVAYDAGAGSDWPAVWLVTCIVFAYFVGTAWYVKTIIRERGSRAYFVASVGHHLVTAGLIPVVAALFGVTATLWPFIVLFLVLAVRAAIVPRTSATPKQTGIGEIVASTIVTVLALVTIF